MWLRLHSATHQPSMALTSTASDPWKAAPCVRPGKISPLSSWELSWSVPESAPGASPSVALGTTHPMAGHLTGNLWGILASCQSWLGFTGPGLASL